MYQSNVLILAVFEPKLSSSLNSSGPSASHDNRFCSLNLLLYLVKRLHPIFIGARVLPRHPSIYATACGDYQDIIRLLDLSAGSQNRDCLRIRIDLRGRAKNELVVLGGVLFEAGRDLNP